MKLSRTTAYAVQALLQLAAAEAEAPISCNRLAKEGRMPERFLLQILRSLVNSGLLRSIRGVEGGYLLAKPPAEITLLDVYEACDTPIAPRIPQWGGMSNGSRANLLKVMQRIADATRRELSQVSVADLLEENQTGQGQS